MVVVLPYQMLDFSMHMGVSGVSEEPYSIHMGNDPDVPNNVGCPCLRGWLRTVGPKFHSLAKGAIQ